MNVNINSLTTIAREYNTFCRANISNAVVKWINPIYSVALHLIVFSRLHTATILHEIVRAISVYLIHRQIKNTKPS